MGNASTMVASALPLLPPVPAGPEPQFRARGLAALIAALDDAVIRYRGPSADAIVVVVGGRVLDAISVPVGRQPLVGLDALNTLAPADPSTLRAAAVERRVALALPGYWREVDRVPPVSARWVDAAGMVEAMIRPGRRGTVILQSPADLGLVLFDDSGLIAAYSHARPEPGGLVTLAGLLTDADTTIRGRIADAPGPSGRQEEGPAALPDPIERCRGEILQMVQAALHLHAEPVLACFRAAPGTAQGLFLAADEVRGMRVRLVSPVTLSSIAEQAGRIVRTAAGGT